MWLKEPSLLFYVPIFIVVDIHKYSNVIYSSSWHIQLNEKVVIFFDSLQKLLQYNVDN